MKIEKTGKKIALFTFFVSLYFFSPSIKVGLIAFIVLMVFGILNIFF